jgi:hypothetical protein
MAYRLICVFISIHSLYFHNFDPDPSGSAQKAKRSTESGKVSETSLLSQVFEYDSSNTFLNDKIIRLNFKNIVIRGLLGMSNRVGLNSHTKRNTGTRVGRYWNLHMSNPGMYSFLCKSTENN